MESLQSLKLRLAGVKNINQITKAMELVAATKMRRSQEIAISSRPYVFAALDFLANMTRLAHVPLPALLTPRARHADAAHSDSHDGASNGILRTAYVIVTSDKGLAGSFNNSVLRTFEKLLRAGFGGIPVSRENDRFIGVGQKAAAYLEKNVKLDGKFVRVGDHTTIEEVKPVADLLIDRFLKGDWDRVVAISTHFRSALRQEVLVRELLPATFASLKKTAEEIVPEAGKYRELVRAHAIPLFETANAKSGAPAAHKEAPDYIIEPRPEIVLEQLARHLVVMEIYHLILEANASEHAARRMAMKNASDNAKELAEELSIQYNKSRQAAITREIIEITAGAESLA